MSIRQNRRRFLQQASVAGAAVSAPYFFTAARAADENETSSSNDRPTLGCIGTGSRWRGVGNNAMQFSDCVAVCDVDRNHLESAAKTVEKRQKHAPDIYEDYREILDRKDIDVVTIVTPDHWHTKIAIDAMRAGKDVYCEKPLTLTIEEGRQICDVVRETGSVFQVGTQQRSEMGLRFLNAVALIRDGRIGDIQQVHVAIGGSPTSGAIPVAEIPSGLNWERWLGQAPMVDYRTKSDGRRNKTRCHYEFRWWYEYSGGKLTDWGAHHVDIAQWGIDQLGEGQGPLRIEPLEAEHPVAFEKGHPAQDDAYNTATRFLVRATFPNDVEMLIRHSWDDDENLKFGNGIMFTGSEGRILVNRGRLSGAAVEQLKDSPLPEDALRNLYGGREPGGNNAHMKNFFDCLRSREQPISDVFTHHRALTTCHLANIAIRLNRGLEWDAKAEQIVGDEEANGWQRREQREGYEIKV